MKVLYVLWNYPQLSETYVTAEISFFMRNGIEVEVWAPLVQDPHLSHQCPVHRESLAQALADVRPDVVHIHYLVMAERHLPEIPAEIPVTIRAHSFDWKGDLGRRLAELPQVRKIYAFPHFARQVEHPKVTPLPVAYASAVYKGSSAKDRRMVLRLAAGLYTKGLPDFFKVAELLPGYRFVLGVARAGGASEMPEFLTKLNEKGLVDLRFDVPWAEAARLTAEAGIYLDTSDPKGHPFGMPISIAESLATGSFVLARRSDAAYEYVDKAGFLYDSVDEAAALVRLAEAMTSGEWAATRRAAIFRSSLFMDTAVLPRVLEDWEAISEMPKRRD